jgi:hypothetical protein
MYIVPERGCPVRLSLSARISQPFSNVFLSQQINISINSSRRNHQPKHVVEPKEASIPQKPANENALMFSL